MVNRVEFYFKALETGRANSVGATGRNEPPGMISELEELDPGSGIFLIRVLDKKIDHADLFKHNLLARTEELAQLRSNGTHVSQLIVSFEAVEFISREAAEKILGFNAETYDRFINNNASNGQPLCDFILPIYCDVGNGPLQTFKDWDLEVKDCANSRPIVHNDALTGQEEVAVICRTKNVDLAEYLCIYNSPDGKTGTVRTLDEAIALAKTRNAEQV